MADDLEAMRLKLDDSKAKFFSKLQLLEEQITDTIETTGTTVKSTVGAVENAVHSVSNALDVRAHFERHPWWWMGGALVAGYVASNLHHRTVQVSKPKPLGLQEIASLDSLTSENFDSGQDSASSLSALSAAYELGSRQSSANQARSLAMNAAIRILEEVVSRSVPMLIAHLSKGQEKRSQ